MLKIVFILFLGFFDTPLQGSNSVNFYNGFNLLSDTTNRLIWTWGIKIDLDNFEIHFQPVFKIGKGPEHPRHLWRDFASGDIRRGYIKYDRDLSKVNFSLTIGRDSLAVGPNGLFISGKAPGIDMLYLSVDFFKRLHFQYGTSILEQVDSNNRYFSFHALEFLVHDWMRVGAAEAVVYGGFGVAPISYFLNPLAFYYHYQEIWADRVYDNILWDFWAVLGRRNAQISIEFLIDDWPYEVEENEHPQIAWALKSAFRPLENTELNFKYHGATKWTYTHKRGFTGFTRFGYPIGDSIGPDFDRFALSIFRSLNNFRLKFMAAYTRKGEATIKDYIKPHPWPDEFFLTGVVEKRWEFGLGILDFELPFPNTSLDFETHLFFIQNFRHELDSKKFLPTFSIFLKYSS